VLDDFLRLRNLEIFSSWKITSEIDIVQENKFITVHYSNYCCGDWLILERKKIENLHNFVGIFNNLFM
jgi:hypothetical protein